MSLFKVFDIAGSGMLAESVRLNVTASNIANADSTAAAADDVYRARHPVFRAALLEAEGGEPQAVGVQVTGIVESRAPAQRVYQPGNPLADEQGYVFTPNVDVVQEMANLISASRTFQGNVEVFNTAKQMLLRTLSLGQ